MDIYQFDQMTLKTQYQEVARRLYNKKLCELKPHELNFVIAEVVKNKVIAPNFDRANALYSEQKIAVYFSIEFLIGRVVLDALTNAGLMKVTRKIFDEEGIDITCLEEVEDTALGNGGLGRLAACFIESAATMGYPLYGVGLYYKYGLFKQTFNHEGHQVEVPDDWTAKGDPWFKPNYSDAVMVYYQDTCVRAVPYVMPIIGYNASRDSFQGNAFPLTLWKAEPIPGATNESAAKISDFLYPNDGNDEGKKLRIRQEYFFVSAELQRLFKFHKFKHGNLDNIEDYYVFQMNDTHPVFACLEFIRLLKEEGYSFDEAFDKAKKCFAYTNHTIMSEALETWSINLFKDILPNIFKVVQEINQKLVDELKFRDGFCTSVWRNNRMEKEPDWQLIRQYEMFDHGMIHMSRIACYMAYSINGVAAVHTEIIKQKTLAGWYQLYPWKFNNKTNGVTPRRWIKLANYDLAKFLDKYLGKGWVTDLPLLEGLEQYKNNHEVLSEFAGVKRIAKQHLADYIAKHEGIQIDVNTIFDCQVKRIHEYKRQLMNALRILYIYTKLKKGELPDFYPTTFIIGGKAAAAYDQAKLIIALIKDIQDMINNDPDVNDKMKVVFLTNFNISYGEKIYAGANFSEQISTAGTEASGTGNMKFMMNGAPTIGTSDGANIEIADEASPKNNYIFGATVEEFRRNAPIYRHDAILDANPELVDLLEFLKGLRNLRGTYWNLVNTLLFNDTYFVMYDLQSYIDITLKANKHYGLEQTTGDLTYYTRKSFKNTAKSGKFSSDRTILDYVSDIWHIAPVTYN